MTNFPFSPNLNKLVTFFFLLYNIVLVLPYINMNPPWVYTCSPSCTTLPPPSPYHPSGLSQCTSPKLPVCCIEPGLAIHFLYDIIHVLMPFSQIIPTPNRVQKTVRYINVSFAAVTIYNSVFPVFTICHCVHELIRTCTHFSLRCAYIYIYVCNAWVKFENSAPNKKNVPVRLQFWKIFKCPNLSFSNKCLKCQVN